MYAIGAEKGAMLDQVRPAARQISVKVKDRQILVAVVRRQNLMGAAGAQVPVTAAT
jgi:hypothetical protein